MINPRALANGVLMYARHIDQLDQLGDLVAKIINKHVALQILPEHYPIAGTCLLRAISEVLGDEIATPEVMSAWGAAMVTLAEILIGAKPASTTRKNRRRAAGAEHGNSSSRLKSRKARKSPRSTSSRRTKVRSSPQSLASTSA